MARTHLDLADAAHGEGSSEAAAARPLEARNLFTALEVPEYVEWTQQLAAKWGVLLPRENTAR